MHQANRTKTPQEPYNTYQTYQLYFTVAWSETVSDQTCYLYRDTRLSNKPEYYSSPQENHRPIHPPVAHINPVLHAITASHTACKLTSSIDYALGVATFGPNGSYAWRGGCYKEEPLHSFGIPSVFPHTPVAHVA